MKMYLIELVTDRYIVGGMTRSIMGYKETEDEAKEYCKRKTEELKGTYNEEMGYKYFDCVRVDLLAD
jgi:hypothetical protein